MSGSAQIHSEADVYIVLAQVRRMMRAELFTETDVQKVLVSISELTRNVIDHANCRGSIWWRVTSRDISVRVCDKGPGIPNVDAILAGVEPHTNAKGLGLGLSGAKRLMDEFLIDSSERGTNIHVIKRKTET